MNLTNEHLLDAIKHNMEEETERLIKLGANVNYDNDRPLRYASIFYNTKIMKLLILNGAEVNCNNINPIIKSSEKGDIEMINFLLENGADPSLNDQSGLRYAKDFDTITLLLTHPKTNIKEAISIMKGYESFRQDDQIKLLEDYLDIPLPDVKVAQ